MAVATASIKFLLGAMVVAYYSGSSDINHNGYWTGVGKIYAGIILSIIGMCKHLRTIILYASNTLDASIIGVIFLPAHAPASNSKFAACKLMVLSCIKD
jgi:hypothetical protein